MYDRGISKEGEILDLGTNLNILQKSGTWYSYGEERIGQGREIAKKYLFDNPSVKSKVEQEIREKYFNTENEMSDKVQKDEKK